MMKRFLSGKSLLIFCSLAGALTLRAQTERDMRFVEKLNEIQFYDYSEFFLRDLLKKKPSDPERGQIYVQLVESLLYQNKVDDAMKIYGEIKRIPRGVEYVQRANGVLGVYYYSRDPQKALSYMKPMMKYCIDTKQKPSSWEKPSAVLLKLLKEQGLAQESEKLVEWLQSGQDQDDREKLLSQCNLRMDTIEYAVKGETETLRRFNEVVAEVRKDKERKGTLEDLLQAKDAAEKQGQSIAARSKAYKALGDFLGMDLTPVCNYYFYDPKRGEVKEVFLKRAEITQDQIKKVRSSAQRGNDWMTSLVATLFDLESIQWGGQDVASVSAAALVIRGLYLMDEYTAGILQAKKFEELFDECDKMFAEEGHPEFSPGSDARIWEGYCNLALARSYMKKDDKKNAKKHYVRAFKNFGTVLKNCPKHRLGPETYGTFEKVVEELSALAPSLASKLKTERAKVPKPEGQAAGPVKLVPPMVEEYFRQKNYQKVVDELMPIMQAAGSRRSPGFPELLNKLAISQVLVGDHFTPLAISDYMASIFPEDPYTLHTLKVCANLIWQKAVEKESDPKSSKQEKEAARKTKDEAAEFYRLFLKVGISDAEAVSVAMRLANEYYNRANALGNALNAEKKDEEKRTELKRAWIEAFDRAVEHYQFIIDNFGNREGDLNVAYLRAAECYVITERYELAAAAYAKYCSSDPEDKVLLLQAKENVAETLYRCGSEHEKKRRALKNEAAALIIPDLPEKPVEPVKPAALAAASSETSASSAAPSSDASASSAAPSSDAKTKEEEKYRKAVEAYKLALSEYENASRAAEEVKKEKSDLEKQAEAEKVKADGFYRQAIAQLDELSQWLADGSKVMAGIRKMKTEAKSDKRGEIDKKVKAVSKLSSRLRPWLYDSIGDNQKAIAAFLTFIRKNKAQKDPKDNIPGYMMRVGMLYMDIGESAKAQDILNELSRDYPDSPEAKNAKFVLAKELYRKETYDKAMPIFKDIFESAELNNLTVSNLRWIASQLSPCPSEQYAKQAAHYSLLSSQRLLEKLKKPDYEDWVGEEKASEFKASKKAREQFESQMTQQLNLDAGRAALALDRYDEAIKYLTKVYELDKNTPYFNQLFFTRAEAYVKIKDYASARRDLSRIASRAMVRSQAQKQPKYWLYNKAQTLIGDTYMAENNPAKAYTIYSMVALPAVSKKDTKAEPPSDPEDDSALYVERAVYSAALTAARIGRTADRDLFVEGYKKLYPQGKYLAKINNLPPADAK